ncbi:MAG: 1-acyl-sn-glycerol-3-phosphate acyltransferase [Prevotellaceae bacterium]|nr:1-acyl-sn-glycerol-3-phosphate acyltransferase [Prevotellaceae bacterium]
MLKIKNIFKKLKTFNLFSCLSEFSPENHKWLVVAFIVITVALFFFSFGTKFETNLQSINYMTDEQRAEMNKLIEENKGKGKTVYFVAEGKTVDEALQNYEKDVAPQISEYNHSGISNLFPSKELQKQKIERWNEFWKNKKVDFQDNFNKISEKQGFNSGVFDNFNDLLNKDFQPQKFEYFTPIYKDLGNNYFSIQDDKTLIYTVLQMPDTASSSTPLTPLTPENNSSNSSTPLTPENNSSFTFDDTSIAQKMVSALSDDFNNVLFICAFIVFVFLFFSFRRIEIAILTFIPMAVAWVWILGLMNIFGLKFNIVNIILATFIFGQGDDYTIFVTEGLIYEYSYRKKMLVSFKNSIILSATILFIAIGMLIFAKHPAMRSLAELAIVGMISVVMCAYLFPPLIYRWLVGKNGQKRLMPITLWNWLKTVYSFIIFFFCSIIVTLSGFFILTIGGKTKQHKLLYHKVLCKGFRILAKMMSQVKYNVHNPTNENFEKPAVIICNHQSHLDLLYTLLLSPKIIALTNKWVWNSPFYGWIIRYADFLPIADGIEQHVDTLKKFVDNGYSILVFPEGTRSADCSIGRFHKGAFYLAERLKLDIIPIVIHGVGHVMPKQEFLLRKGKVDVEIHERYKYRAINDEYRDNVPHSVIHPHYSNLSKYFRNFYKEKYAELAKKIETPAYFKDLVLKNYLYKGAEIERGAKREMKKIEWNRNEKFFAPAETANYLIKNNGYGVFSLLFALVNKTATVYAAEENDDLRALAQNNISKPDNLIICRECELPKNMEFKKINF